jgi:hypothetical protein
MELPSSLAELLEGISRIALETCDIVVRHNGPRKRYSTNVASKHQRREYQMAAQLQTAMRIARHDDWEQHLGWDKVTHPDIPRRPEGSQTHDEWTEALKEQRAGAKKRLDSLRKEEKREHSKRVRLKWQREYPNRMRQGNKEIFRDEDQPSPAPGQGPRHVTRRHNGGVHPPDPEAVHAHPPQGGGVQHQRAAQPPMDAGMDTGQPVGGCGDALA